jgi:hypothetical protein
MSPNNGLKVCTFNAKCDEVDYKCCIKDTCFDNGCEKFKGIPDSLLAALISITILPSKADIYNIQNVRNKCVVEHLIKEIFRVKHITDKIKPDDCCVTADFAFMMDIACELNAFTGLCDDAVAVKDALSCCKICDLDYVDTTFLQECRGYFGDDSPKGSSIQRVYKDVLKYKGVDEYNAYYNGNCLSLVKKSLCITPVTCEIECVDSLVMFFEHKERRFINVNVNLGDYANTIEDIGSKREKVEKIICFLRKYQDCGAIIMSGYFGDFDYDTSQLLFKGDGEIPEIAQILLANGVTESPVPSDFPCELEAPIYEIMEFLLKTCHAEMIPYSWLLQYLRLKGYKKCCLYKLLQDKDKVCKRKCEPERCDIKCKEDCDDRRKGSNVRNVGEPFYGNNRSQLRNSFRKSDKSRIDNAINNGNNRVDANTKDNNPNLTNTLHNNLSYNNNNGRGVKCINEPTICDKPACVKAKRCCCEKKCVKVCEDKCQIEYKHCECEKPICEIRCREKEEDCCDDSKYRVRVDVCKNLCKKKPCCGSCAEGKECEGEQKV